MGADAAAAEEFGPYLVYERLGIGGMATVHRAVERADVEGFERVVALKRLLPHLAEDATFIKAFVREAKLAALLTHVNISQIYDLGRVGTQYFIAMEYIDGCDVRRILRHARSISTPPPIHVTVGVILQLCDALDYAHTKTDDADVPLGLVHRDVSPSNLLITTTGHLKVIDFGIAKAQSLQLRTQTGRVKGKLAYMAPEAVLASKELDARSDLWAVGVILHELLTARPLFWSKNEYQTLIKIDQGNILPPSTFNPACPPELDAIVIKALARPVNERFASAADIRDDLMRVRRDNQLATTERDIAQWLGPALPSILRYKASSSPQLQAPPHPTSPPPTSDHSLEEQARRNLSHNSPTGDSNEAAERPSDPDWPAPAQHAAIEANPAAPIPKAERVALETNSPALIPNAEYSSLQRPHPLGERPLTGNFPRVTRNLEARAESQNDSSPLGGEETDAVWGTDPEDHAVVLDDVPDVANKHSAAPPTGPIAPASADVRPTATGTVHASPFRSEVPAGYRQAVRFSTFFRRSSARAPRFTATTRAMQRWLASVFDRITARGPSSRVKLQPWRIGLGLAAIALVAAMFTLYATRTDAPSNPSERSATHGTIEIVVVPSDAEIKIGDRRHTGSPWKAELPAGTYELVVQRPEYEPWRASVDLSLGELQRFRLALVPSTANAARFDHDEEAKATLAIATRPPGLEIILDGQLLDHRTPITLAIRPGDHVIVLRQAGIERWWQGFHALPTSRYEFSPVFSNASP